MHSNAAGPTGSRADTTGEVAPSLKCIRTPSGPTGIYILLYEITFVHADALFISLYKGYWSGTRGSSLIHAFFLMITAQSTCTGAAAAAVAGAAAECQCAR